jgi:hypothetical protein
MIEISTKLTYVPNRSLGTGSSQNITNGGCIGRQLEEHVRCNDGDVQKKSKGRSLLGVLLVGQKMMLVLALSE